MTKTILSLYDYMLENKKIVDHVLSVSEIQFLKNDNLVNIGYGIVFMIMDGLASIDERIMANDDYIFGKSKELFSLKKYLNKDDNINGYLVYDFLKVEYDLLLQEIKKLLGL